MSLPDFTIVLPTVGAVDAAWEASGLATISAEAIRDGDSYDLIPAARAFLDALYSDGHGTRFDFVEGAFPSTTCGTTAACFGHDYILFREALFHADRDSFDRIFAAFVPKPMRNNLIDRYDCHKLQKLGIWVLYEPETSAALAKLTRVYSMSTLLALLADQGPELPEKIAQRLGELTDFENIHCQDLLTRYQELTAGWAAALRCASTQQRLLIAYVE
jgi:hypothetical protein